MKPTIVIAVVISILIGMVLPVSAETLKDEFKNNLKETKNEIKNELKETKNDAKTQIEMMKEDIKTNLKELKDKIKYRYHHNDNPQNDNIEYNPEKLNDPIDNGNIDNIEDETNNNNNNDNTNGVNVEEPNYPSFNTHVKNNFNIISGFEGYTFGTCDCDRVRILSAILINSDNVTTKKIYYNMNNIAWIGYKLSVSDFIKYCKNRNFDMDNRSVLYKWSPT